MDLEKKTTTRKYPPNICWDCMNAVGKCSWSASYKPIEGWTATFIPAEGTKSFDSYCILDCPEFIRDSYDGGQRRTPREIKLDKR